MVKTTNQPYLISAGDLLPVGRRVVGPFHAAPALDRAREPLQSLGKTTPGVEKGPKLKHVEHFFVYILWFGMIWDDLGWFFLGNKTCRLIWADFFWAGMVIMKQNPACGMVWLDVRGWVLRCLAAYVRHIQPFLWTHQVPTHVPEMRKVRGRYEDQRTVAPWYVDTRAVQAPAGTRPLAAKMGATVSVRGSFHENLLW